MYMYHVFLCQYHVLVYLCIVWMLSFVYIRDKPSLTRIVLFIIYNVGIYNIILTPLCDHHLNHAECEEAVKPIPINEIVQNRNWNIKKKQ